MPYVDVHCHLTHKDFDHDLDAVVKNASKLGLKHIISNGLNPQSNRQALTLAAKYPVISAAAGIYPIDAVNHLLPDDFTLKIEKFNVDQEIATIAEYAQQKKIIAVGECGLDGYWVDESFFAEQERVFEALIGIALSHDLPLIVHTRKREKRSFEILESCGVKKVNFHCYGGKVKMALRYAEKHGWWFSIPANSRNNDNFTKMLRELPLPQILTETDAPYLAPKRGERNEPANVCQTVSHLAELRNFSLDQAMELIENNYYRLFGNCEA
jgi:TatD DNase family protein